MLAAPESGEALLRWFEEYAARLHGGVYCVTEIEPHASHAKRTRGICLFPERSPAVSEAETQGLVVRASALFVPEASEISLRHKNK